MLWISSFARWKSGNFKILSVVLYPVFLYTPIVPTYTSSPNFTPSIHRPHLNTGRTLYTPIWNVILSILRSQNHFHSTEIHLGLNLKIDKITFETDVYILHVRSELESRCKGTKKLNLRINTKIKLFGFWKYILLGTCISWDMLPL